MHLNVGVIGCGNSARALAFYLIDQGYGVWLYTRSSGKYAKLKVSKTINAFGKMQGTAKLAGVTENIELFTAKVSIIFVATQATAYREVAENLDPILKVDQHFIILFSGKLLGCLDFKQGLQKHNKDGLKVLETDSIFASRIQPDESIQIRGIKDWTLFGASTRTEALEYGKVLKIFFPKLQPAQNLIERGLTDFGAVAHAVISLANISKIDQAEDFLFYYDGLSENTICLLEAAEREFSLLAKAYGFELLPMKELLNRYYGCDTSSLLNAMRTVPNYRDSKGPKQVAHRYLQEDVSCTLIPMLELAEKAEVNMPMVSAVVNICSTLAKKDFRTEGRNLRKLGLADYSSREILTLLEK